jgi:NTP pyrophosphatase (non-canonical NTP hydrolase)
MTIKEWQVKINEWCTRKGWNENLVLGNMIANLHTEISEAWEEIRNNRKVDEIYGHAPISINNSSFLCGIESLARDATIKPEGFPIELADLAIRLFHLCEYCGIDLEKMIELKMAYNETRSYRHGGKKA